jgi:hypothetical protein
MMEYLAITGDIFSEQFSSKLGDDFFGGIYLPAAELRMFGD